MEALKKEIHWQSRNNNLANSKISSIFIGGGTPNLYPAEDLIALINEIKQNFDVESDAEITTEMNPEFIPDKEYLNILNDNAFNRYSLGVQSLQDDELHLLGRIHTAEQAEKVLSWLNTELSGQWSADIMYNIPRQTTEKLVNTLHRILSYQPSHISAYSLTREEGTLYNQMFLDGKITELSEDRQLNLLNTLHRQLIESGLHHYEISNFARPGKESRHNKHYWDFGDYLGLGAGAHSKIGWKHFAHSDNLSAYLKASEKDDFRADFSEELTEEQYLIEFIMLKLRTAKGINGNELNEKHWEIISKVFFDINNKLPDDYLIFDKKNIRCNFKGWQLLDTILLQAADSI